MLYPFDEISWPRAVVAAAFGFLGTITAIAGIVWSFHTVREVAVLPATCVAAVFAAIAVGCWGICWDLLEGP